MKHQVICSTDIAELPEHGEAWLLDAEGQVRAKFYDGNFVRIRPKAGDTEETKAAA